MKRIIIEFIPHTDQRYDTCGDWRFLGRRKDEEFLLKIWVSQTPDWRSAALVAVHELVEALCCKFAGITTEQVDEFDFHWTPNSGHSEPGDDPTSPYFHQHRAATHIEKLLATYLGILWEDHEKQLDALGEASPK